MKGTIFKIYSRGIDRETNGLINYRTEFIDIEKNYLFRQAKSVSDIKKIYERFWNISRTEKVIVDKIEEVNIKSRGANWNIKMLK